MGVLVPAMMSAHPPCVQISSAFLIAKRLKYRVSSQIYASVPQQMNVLLKLASLATLTEFVLHLATKLKYWDLMS
jgi:hypothetical protein